MVIYSHSRLSTFEQCPLKFKFQYIDNLSPEVKETIESFLGKKVHESLEWLYKRVMQKESVDIESLVKYYVNLWEKDFDPEIRIVKSDLDKDYYFNQGIRFLINYFNSNSPFKDNTIALEKRILIYLDKDKKYALQGYIDRLVHDKESNIFEIHDYKTGYPKSQGDLDKDRQLALYSLGIRQEFKEVNDVHFIWHYLAINKKMVSKRTVLQLENLSKEIIGLIDKIELAKEFNPNPSILCRWCEFRSYCPLFNGHKSSGKVPNPDDGADDSDSWSLYENGKELQPLVFSNGKSQKDIVKEVVASIKKGSNVIFIKGMCGTGKSALALNIARKLGRTSIIVPVKSLQEQYAKDYSEKKYVLNNGQKLKISSIVGRPNFKCKYLKENEVQKRQKEENANLNDIFSGRPVNSREDDTCNNNFLPCKIEIKEKNLDIIKDYIKNNPHVKFSDFDSINDIKRMAIAPVCPYWCPIVPEEFEVKKFSNSKKIKYPGLCNKNFIIHQRKKGCGYYDQYEAYSDSDVIIFNSLKYRLETLMDRKPSTEIEIIDECDDFLDSFANQERLNLSRLLFSLTAIKTPDNAVAGLLDSLIDLINSIRVKYTKDAKGEEFSEIFRMPQTPIEELLKTTFANADTLEQIDLEESNYLYHLCEVAKMFSEFSDETFFSVEKKDSDLTIHLVTPNLAKRLKELIAKNKAIIMMSGTIHSPEVLKNVFGIDDYKIIEAEVNPPGRLIKCRTGDEMDCKYSNFKSGKVTRNQYLSALSNAVSCAKTPVLVHVTGFSDLPSPRERADLQLDNLPSSYDLMQDQQNDPLGKKVREFREGKTKILFTTKCSRGIDFPGETCNSIVITRFPYPDLSSIFWRIVKEKDPKNFMRFYIDKANRDLLQKVYRGLRSKEDKIYLLSPDIRVLQFKFDNESKE
jgi:putative RecB family exonuclease